MIRLTDEEIKNLSDNIACSFIGSVAESGLEPGPIIKRAIAKAQLKKVLSEAKTEDLSCKFRQALLEEVK